MVLVYSKYSTNRMDYILDLFFSTLMGVEYELTTDIKEFKASKAIKINYSESSVSKGEIHIQPHGLLKDTKINPLEPGICESGGIPCLFPVSGPADLPFDVFSAAFYMVTRYEEYLPFEPDKYGRFKSTSGIACKHGFVELPVVDYWNLMLIGAILKKYPDTEFNPLQYHFKLTIDVDSAWAVLHKGFIRTSGSLLKSLGNFRIVDFFHKLFVLARISPDPFYSFTLIKKYCEQFHIRPVFFFLLGDYSRFDKNVSPKNLQLQKLIKRLSKNYSVGIHPSFRSNSKSECLSKEVNILRKIIKRKVKKSRQHYLKLKFPNTYQNLIREGIEEDYSMGFCDMPGFRAGIAHPFCFYDLLRERTTDLRIFPFQIMDATLNRYLKLKPDEAIQKIHQMILKVREVNGTFVALWHNESLSNRKEWKGWNPVFEYLLLHAK